MMEIPSSPWQEAGGSRAGEDPISGMQWRAIDGCVVHIFTHFRLELSIKRGVIADGQFAEGKWTRIEDLKEEALPSVMRKIVAQVLG